VSILTSPTVLRRWSLPILIGVFTLLAGYLNAGPMLSGARPGVAGVLASLGYCAAWLVQAFIAGRLNSCRTLRGMAGFWAVVIACAAICTTFVRLDARSGVGAGDWAVVSLLVATTAPLYGLAGAFTGEPLAVLAAVTAATGVLTLGLAAAVRKLAPAAS
jgi:hypothetical protein